MSAACMIKWKTIFRVRHTTGVLDLSDDDSHDENVDYDYNNSLIKNNK